ncbi:MAG: hypothetical protein ACM3PZ_02955 [Bacillota bacterium]
MKKATIAAFAAMGLIASTLSVQAIGNGAPSGSHYNLNLIGVSKDKTSLMDSNDGHRIFVNLEGKTSIKLTEGNEFAVLDANGTDGNGARFQLPNPDPDNDGVTVYSVYARPLGTPGGNATLSTCATGAGVDGIFGTADDEEVCSLATLSVSRTAGKSKFTDVSKQLLYVFADLDGDGTAERYPLFSDALQDYFWSYDNQGLKVVQLRFYEVSSSVN